ncbi:hypothetical protein [Vagococcus fluvialis]|uniref:hypothetical protein n=1 Tax=Vagococcus fluvialis TaxID=2738 RepID=UPI003B5B08EF
MANPFVGILLKAMKYIGPIIMKQITDYVSSEQFNAQAKKMIQMVVERMVKIVMHEKKIKSR